MSTGAVARIGRTPVGDDLVPDRPGTADTAAADERATDVYAYAVKTGGIDSVAALAAELGRPEPEVFTAVARLVELTLLHTEEGTVGRLVPTDPQVATSMLVSPIERAMYRRRELADRLRSRIEAIAPARVGPIDGLEGAAEIRGLLALEAEVCRREVLVIDPGLDGAELLGGGLDELAARGVTVRLVCGHRARADFGSRARVKRLVERGASVRTLTQVPQAAVVFDGALAVMVAGDGGTVTGRRVRDGDVVRFLVDLFDVLWEGATPFETEDPGYAGIVDDIQQSIARLLAQGFTDEVVARRLNMSVRTCRRHIAALLANLDSVSRFQAGVAAAQLLAHA